MFERSEFAILPFSAAHRWEPRRGRDRAVAFFCLAFLGETRKVSGCRAAPGKLVRREVSKERRPLLRRPCGVPGAVADFINCSLRIALSAFIVRRFFFL